MKFLAPIFCGFVFLGQLALAKEDQYRFEIENTEIFSIARGPSGYREWKSEFDLPLQVTQDYLKFDPIAFSNPICHHSAAGYPKVLGIPIGATLSFDLGERSFSRVRSADIFFRITQHQADDTFEVLVVCSWLYSGGGSGSHTMHGTAKKL